MRPPTSASLGEAAKRYATRKPKNPARRPTRRETYLSRTAARDRARALVLEAEAAAPKGSSQTHTLRSLSQERIIGAADLFDLNYLELAIAVARAVARVRLPDGAASGFLAGPGLLITNNHVIGSAAEANGAIVQLDYQEDSSGELLTVQAFAVDPARFFVTDATLDFTVVGLAARSTSGRALADYPWLKLIGTLGKADRGDPVNIIQHPLGGLKQIAFRNNEIIEIPEGRADFLYYTTDTQQGSSGAPCFNDQWELVALHHSGVPQTKAGKVVKTDGTPWRDGKDDPSTVAWIANEGARVSAIVAALRAAQLGSDEAQLRDAMLDGTPPNPVELARRGAGASSLVPGVTQLPALTGSTTTALGAGLSIRVEVADDVIRNVAIGRNAHGAAGVATGVGQGPALANAPPPLPVEKNLIDPDWKTRRGYDRDFLGVRVALPKLGTAQRAITTVVPPEHRRSKSDKHGLHYHHYSLTFNERRRLAWYSACNVDGDRMFKVERAEDWYIDPRIDDPDQPVRQMGEELYSAKNTDRGHLTRFLDVCWGDDEMEAKLACGDTFHFSNCALQLQGFNRGSEEWQGLEKFLLEKKARKEKRRINVFTGPVFRDDDPLYKNSAMSYTTRVPLQFWKLCTLVRQDGTLAATAFRLGQPAITDLPGFLEAFDVIAAQVTVAELEALTGLDFGKLTDHDHFAAGGAPGTLESIRFGKKRKVLPLRSLEEIVV